MTEQLCPGYCCSIMGLACEEEGVKYCCESGAADSERCDCGCGHPID